jgi:hypothetical protein
VVAELMQKRAQEGPERDHAAVLYRSHPERDDRRSPSAGRFVQSVQFTPGR